MPNQNTFESVLLRLRRAIRRDQRRSKDATPTGYLSPDGNILLWTGDDDAPYVKVVNPASDPVQVTIAGGGGLTAMVEGFTPDGDPDPLDENPVFVGGRITLGPRVPTVAAGARVGWNSDDRARQRVRISGDDAFGDPFDVPLDSVGALFVGGQAVHGDPDVGNPLLLGGHAYAETPAAVDADDRVRWYFSEEGRAVVLHDLAFAGENLLFDYKRTLIAPAPFEQDSLLSQSIIATGAVSAITLKAAAGRLYRVFALNTSGAVAYLQVRNATGTGAPTMSALAIPTGSSGSIDFGNFGRYMDTGITIQLSSTQSTYTAINMGATGCHLTGDYI